VGEALVHRGDDVRHPVAARVQRRLPRRRLDDLVDSPVSEALITSPALLRQRETPV
jgi:hypothetical protein